jgi:hypothetical protein
METGARTVSGANRVDSKEHSALRKCVQVALLSLCVDNLVADELWSWHAFDAKVIKTSKIETTVHTRFRTGKHFGNMQQRRAGVIGKITASKQIAVITGYYYGKEEDSAEDWINSHRVFGGIELPIHSDRKVSVTTRGLVERFFVADRPGFTRYRQRVRLAKGGTIGPYASTEWFFDAKGWLSARTGVGIRWQAARWSSLEIGYLYDWRRAAIGDARHVLVTQFTLERLHK